MLAFGIGELITSPLKSYIEVVSELISYFRVNWNEFECKAKSAEPNLYSTLYLAHTYITGVWLR